MKINEVFFLHTIQFTRKCAAVRAEIISKTDAANRQLEMLAALQLCLQRKIGQQFFPQGPFRYDFYLLHELDIFVRNHRQDIFNEPMMKSTGT